MVMAAAYNRLRDISLTNERTEGVTMQSSQAVRLGSMLLGSLLCLDAQSSAQEIPRLTFNVHWAETRESRRAQALDWLAEIVRIERQIPTLSPEQNEWLRT